MPSPTKLSADVILAAVRERLDRDVTMYKLWLQDALHPGAGFPPNYSRAASCSARLNTAQDIRDYLTSLMDIPASCYPAWHPLEGCAILPSTAPKGGTD